MKHLLLYFSFYILSINLCAQIPGDEDKEMFNRGKERDQAAIKDAVNGWWSKSMKNHDERIAWWREAKFGMFIHWGIYSLPGGEWKGKKVGGYAEHLMRKEKITRKEYLDLAHNFSPVNFNAEQWIVTAKQAGMKYFIITAKHHDGFAMYDSKFSDFNIIKQSPFGRDPMAELASAARKHGIKFGFYYSHAFDWEHPDAPGNDWEYNNPGGDKLLGGANWYDTHPEWLPKAIKYVDEKAIPQIRELLTKYKPDILWFDTPHKLPLSENIRILKAIRETDSGVVVNGRLVRNALANYGDYKNTADRPAEFYPVTGDWEAIPTTNESYGYSKYDSSHKSIKHFIQLLAKAASGGGNLLMNIGPKGDGSFDQKDLAILEGIGKWMKKNGESVYGTTASPLPKQDWGVITRRNNKLYLHVFNWPADGKLYVGGLLLTPARVTLLNSPAKSLTVKQLGKSSDFYISLPGKAPDSLNTVLVMQLEGNPQVDEVRLLSPNAGMHRLLAYDALLTGKNFGFGDGKTDRYYVDGWKNVEQILTWRFRNIKPGNFKLFIKYLQPAKNTGGEFSVTLYKHTVDSSFAVSNRQFVVDTVSKKGNVVTQQLGNIEVGQGSFNLVIAPVNIHGTELMKLLEVQLVPIKKNDQ